MGRMDQIFRVASLGWRADDLAGVAFLRLLMFCCAAVAALTAAGQDVNAALQDRQRFPQEDWPFLYYLTTEPAEPAARGDLKAAVKLMIASASAQPIVERCTPRDVTATLMRIDTRDLHWRTVDWAETLRGYPYQPVHTKPNGRLSLPLVVRADWLLVELADGTESESYMRLLYGGDSVPQTRAAFMARWEVEDATNQIEPYRFGMIESNSGVAKQEVRWIESFPTKAAYYWATRDVLKVEAGNDPLENPLGSFQHDGEEHIVALGKIHLGTGTRGTLQAYALFNGDGKRVDAAPVDLVEDSTTFRGNREIVAPGSCIQCHGQGINPLKQNEFRHLIRSGVDVYAFKQTQEQLEAFHLGDLASVVASNQSAFQAIVPLVCGLDSLEAAEAFNRSCKAYDRELDLEDAARELGCQPAELRNSLGFYLQPGKSARFPARLAGLPHGRLMPRETWETSAYLEAKEMLKRWQTDF